MKVKIFLKPRNMISFGSTDQQIYVGYKWDTGSKRCEKHQRTHLNHIYLPFEHNFPFLFSKMSRISAVVEGKIYFFLPNWAKICMPYSSSSKVSVVGHERKLEDEMHRAFRCQYRRDKAVAWIAFFCCFVCIGLWNWNSWMILRSNVWLNYVMWPYRVYELLILEK
jgi:hypothetical protein